MLNKILCGWCLRQAICLDLRTVSRGEKLIEGRGDRGGSITRFLIKLQREKRMRTKLAGWGWRRREKVVEVRFKMECESVSPTMTCLLMFTERKKTFYSERWSD